VAAVGAIFHGDDHGLSLVAIFGMLTRAPGTTGELALYKLDRV
jgi:hypothetical protein